MTKVSWFLMVLLVGMLLLIGGCGADNAGEAEEAEEAVPIVPTTPEKLSEYADISIPIEEFPNNPHVDAVMDIGVGEGLVITLGSNPTTGFQWQENATISDKSIVQQVDHKFVASGADVPGSPGQDVWTFEGLKKGTATISMECSRPWEERDQNNWTITVTIIIK